MRMKEHSVIVLWFLVALLIDVAVTTGTLDQLSGKRRERDLLCSCEIEERKISYH